MSRSMIKLIHADDFFPEGEAEKLRQAVSGMNFVEMPYGHELPNFNLIFPDIEQIFYSVLGERVTVDPVRSGIVRKPHNCVIHYENFDSPEEWCFIVALEPTTLNIWHHISQTDRGDASPADYKNAIEGSHFDYNNLFEWKIQTNVLLEQNQGVFIRPWMFHSLEDGLVQYYRLIADTAFRILVMGYPGSKKDSVAEKLSERFQDCVLIDSMQERLKYKTVDFSEAGHLRHCHRILNLVRSSRSKVNIINMSCPLAKMRQILNPDIIVWVSDTTQCEWDSVNQMYEPPQTYDIECKSDTPEDIDRVLSRILTKRIS